MNIMSPILHTKFLLKDYEERKAIAENYDSVRAEAGTGKVYLPFSLPEDSFQEPVNAYKLDKLYKELEYCFEACIPPNVLENRGFDLFLKYQSPQTRFYNALKEI